MLEEILKSINSNLERIANAQEEANILYKNFIEAEIVMDGEKVSAVVDSGTIGEHKCEVATIQQTPNSIIANNNPVLTQTVVAQPAMPQAIPTTQVQESFTQEQLAVAMSNAVSAGKMNVIQGILQQLGVQALTQVNPADYNKVATMLKEAGVEV